MRKIARFILWVGRWKIGDIPEGVEKAVIVVGPHTSNWDFFIGKMAFISYGMSTKILIKKEAFVFPISGLLKLMGGVPVNRKKNNNLTDQAVKYFDERDSLYMLFTPEATRSYNPNWKKGFYYIAQKANVPIFIGFIDYKNRTGGFHSLFTPTGDANKDIRHIKEVLCQYSGRNPENGIKHPDIE